MKKTATLVIITLILMSCNIKKNTSKVPNKTNTKTVMGNTKAPIEDIKWVINTLESVEVYDSKESEAPIYFILDSKTNRISGNAGCNSIMGTYKLESGNRISFSQIATTRMLCLDSKINETQILNIFNTADNYTIINGVLALNKAKRATLATFNNVKTNPILEKYWKLKTLDGKKVSMGENQAREIFFTLKANNNRVTGFAGCNTLGGEFILEAGNRISFTNILTSLKSCTDLVVNEAAFLKIFELVDNYTITKDILSFNIGKRSPLATFEAVYMQ